MINPILASSALRRMRSFKTLLIIGIYVLVLLGVAMAVLASMFGGKTLIIGRMQYGMTAYISLLVAQLFLISLVAPAMTAGSISGERERQTLELLLVTNTGSYGIVLGKWMESFAFMALLIFSGLPVMTLTMLPGGVTLGAVLTGELFLLVYALAVSSVGVLCSSFMRNTVGATIVSYLLLLAFGVVTLLPLFFGITTEMTYGLYDSQRYAAMTLLDGLKLLPKPLLANPGIGFFALMIEQLTDPRAIVLNDNWGRLYATFLMLNKIGFGMTAFINMALMTALAFLASGVAALLVRPRKVRVRKKA